MYMHFYVHVFNHVYSCRFLYPLSTVVRRSTSVLLLSRLQPISRGLTVDYLLIVLSDSVDYLGHMDMYVGPNKPTYLQCHLLYFQW